MWNIIFHYSNVRIPRTNLVKIQNAHSLNYYTYGLSINKIVCAKSPSRVVKSIEKYFCWSMSQRPYYLFANYVSSRRANGNIDIQIPLYLTTENLYYPAKCFECSQNFVWPIFLIYRALVGWRSTLPIFYIHIQKQAWVIDDNWQWYLKSHFFCCQNLLLKSWVSIENPHSRNYIRASLYEYHVNELSLHMLSNLHLQVFIRNVSYCKFTFSRGFVVFFFIINYLIGKKRVIVYELTTERHCKIFRLIFRNNLENQKK